MSIDVSKGISGRDKLSIHIGSGIRRSRRMSSDTSLSSCGLQAVWYKLEIEYVLHKWQPLEKCARIVPTPYHVLPMT